MKRKKKENIILKENYNKNNNKYHKNILYNVPANDINNKINCNELNTKNKKYLKKYKNPMNSWGFKYSSWYK